MTYTPPTAPLDINFTDATYVAPTAPLDIDFAAGPVSTRVAVSTSIAFGMSVASSHALQHGIVASRGVQLRNDIGSVFLVLNVVDIQQSIAVARETALQNDLTQRSAPGQTDVRFGIAASRGVDIRYNIGRVDVSSGASLRWSLSADRAVSINHSIVTAGSVDIVTHIGLPRQTNSTELRWSLAAAGNYDLRHDIIGLASNGVELRYSSPLLRGTDVDMRSTILVMRGVDLPIALLTRAWYSTDIRWIIDEKTPVSAVTDIRYDIVGSSGPVSVSIPILDNSGNVIGRRTITAEPHTSILAESTSSLLRDGIAYDPAVISISQSEDNWTWNWSAEIPDHAEWLALRPRNGNYPAVTLRIRGVDFAVITESANRSESGSGWVNTIGGRGISARLDGKSASGVDTVWIDSTAFNIAQSLCDDAGVLLDWRIIDWPIRILDADGRYPIEIIQQIVNAVGCIAQTTAAGSLVIRERYPSSPATYWDLPTPSTTLTDLDDYQTLDETWDDRDNYNIVSVGDIAADDTLDVSISTEQQDDGSYIVKVFAVPFTGDLTLYDSALGALDVIPQGIVTETIIDTIEIVQGAGRLSNPFYGLVSAQYVHVDCGAATISESGDVVTDQPATSLMVIAYTTKYHKFVARRLSNDERLQVFVEYDEAI